MEQFFVFHKTNFRLHLNSLFKFSWKSPFLHNDTDVYKAIEPTDVKLLAINSYNFNVYLNDLKFSQLQNLLISSSVR